MNPQLFLRHPMPGLRLGVALGGFLLIWPVPLQAQAPVITNPGNLRAVDVNTVFRPLESDPEWLAMAPMPTGEQCWTSA